MQRTTLVPFQFVLLTLLLATQLTLVPEVSANDFYDPSCENRSLVKDLQKDFGVPTDGSRDVSADLQKAIDELSSAGGGMLTMPAGTYQIANVHLKSNVHIGIDHEATLIPFVGNKVKNTTLFSMGKDDEPVENVSVRGLGGRFTAKFFEYAKGLQVVATGNVNNFYIGNFHCEDAKTALSCVNFNAMGLESDQKSVPTKGTIENISVGNAHYGYGVIQAQAAKDVFFKNLSGIGGATLRLETGLAKMNDAQFGGLANIVAENIECINGNSAVMISPHAMTNGVVQITGVKSVGCGFAVRIEGGFVSKKYSTPGLKPGTFAKGSFVKNVDATFGEEAQLKQKHLRYMPPELLSTLEIPEGIGYATPFVGPAIAAVLNDANYDVNVQGVEARGFQFAEDIVTEPVVDNAKNPKANPKKGKGKRKN
ncbi:Iota-carrageenase A2 [Rhodopirellula sallentina]|uniref:Iota-carrageenase A2 n=1 Tax=Rhodopirellula sallentina SM41 TaxID=1263870 RepID=M5U581_9BACT|nr:Iota-carrageenase A2 [Rhodopirellula sallentina]EMI56429.1 Iota-carrageenase A2 [Rhodopirellula sallentina SM41]